MSEMVTEEVVATIEMPVEAEKEKEIKQEVSSVELTAKEMVISSDADYERAAEFGDYIIRKPEGGMIAMSRREFERNYEPL